MWILVAARQCADWLVHGGLAVVWSGGFGQDGPCAPLGALVVADLSRGHVRMGEFLVGLALLGQRPRLVDATVLLAVLFERTVGTAEPVAAFG